MSWDNHWTNLFWENLSEEALTLADYGDSLKLQFLSGLIKKVPIKSILEVGCGTGRVSIKLSSMTDIPLVATDKSIIALDCVRHIAKRFGVFERTKTIMSDGCCLPFRNDSFSLVWSAGLLEHFKRCQQLHIIREMYRVTDRSGVLICIVPNVLCFRWSGKYFIYRLFEKSGSRLRWPYGYERMFTMWGLAKLFKQAIKEQANVKGIFLSPIPWLNPDRTIKYTAMGDGSNKKCHPWITSIHRRMEDRFPKMRNILGKNLVGYVFKKQKTETEVG